MSITIRVDLGRVDEWDMKNQLQKIEAHYQAARMDVVNAIKQFVAQSETTRGAHDE